MLKQQVSIAAPVAVSASLVAAEASVGSAGDLFLVLCHFLLLFSFLILASTDSTIFLVQNRS